jgi:hypothetical protein
MTTLGQAALLVAQNEVGNGEEGRNNRGFHINRYRGGRTPMGGGAWCASFVHYCLLQGWAGLRKPMRQFKLDYTPSASKLVARVERMKGAKQVQFDNIEPGDIMLFDRRGGMHVCIVARVMRTESGEVDSYFTIDGNKGAFPALVKHIRREPYPRPEKIVRV